MAKRTVETGPEDILAGIRERISLLNTLSAAVRYAFYGVVESDLFEDEPEHPTVEQRRTHAAKPKAKVKGRRKTYPRTDLKGKILQTLGKWPGLTPLELYSHVVDMGWRTSSKHPQALIRRVLSAMKREGVVQRVGTDWELVTVQQPEHTVELPA